MMYIYTHFYMTIVPTGYLAYLTSAAALISTCMSTLASFPSRSTLHVLYKYIIASLATSSSIDYTPPSSKSFAPRRRSPSFCYFCYFLNTLRRIPGPMLSPLEGIYSIDRD